MISRAARAYRADCPDVEILLVGSAEALRREGAGFPSESVGSFDGSLESAGDVSLRAIERAVGLAQAGEVQAIVTGPVHKPALAAAGSRHPGQTELLAELSGSRRVGMLMHADARSPVASAEPDHGVPEGSTTPPPGSQRAAIRILLATTHVPLRDVPSLLTGARLEEQTRLLAESLRLHWRLPSPRIALCALNPHASDGGLFGDEEGQVFLPAAEAMRRDGIDVTDPLPADTAFLRLLSGAVDAVVSPYHDVGMAVFKTLAFGRGVNVTLGLPFVRTSPDHGTAFDRAGTGRADPGSAVEALRLARRLASSMVGGSL